MATSKAYKESKEFYLIKENQQIMEICQKKEFPYYCKTAETQESTEVKIIDIRRGRIEETIPTNFYVNKY